MRRKNIITQKLWALLVLALVPVIGLGATSSNYFTMGVNDTVCLSPTDSIAIVPVIMHTNGRMNNWRIKLTYPEGLQPIGVEAGSGMSVTYRNYYNHDTVYHAILAVNTDFTTISSTIPVIGYHDYNHDGYMDPYGNVKWEAGDYQDMFVFTFRVSSTFLCGKVTLDGYFSSDPDQRQGLISPNPCTSYTKVHFYVPIPGDMNHDGLLNLTDVTLLINALVKGAPASLPPVADVNGDGEMNVTDVTALINLIINA